MLYGVVTSRACRTRAAKFASRFYIKVSKKKKIIRPLVEIPFVVSI